MVFFFLHDKADPYHNYTDAGNGMYEHLNFQLKYQHFWACCPKQSGVWADNSSWMDFRTFRNENASQMTFILAFWSRAPQKNTHRDPAFLLVASYEVQGEGE